MLQNFRRSREFSIQLKELDENKTETPGKGHKGRKKNPLCVCWKMGLGLVMQFKWPRLKKAT